MLGEHLKHRVGQTGKEVLTEGDIWANQAKANVDEMLRVYAARYSEFTTRPVDEVVLRMKNNPDGSVSFRFVPTPEAEAKEAEWRKENAAGGRNVPD